MLRVAALQLLTRVPSGQTASAAFGTPSRFSLEVIAPSPPTEGMRKADAD
jgi:hypothetical protein